MYSRLKKLSSLKTIIPGIILTAVIIVIFANTMKVKGFGTKKYYDNTHVYSVLENFKDEDFTNYKSILYLDCLFALAHGLTCIFIIILLYDKKLLKEKISRLLFLIPAAVIFLDLFENMTSIYILTSYPKHVTAASFAGFVTLVKWFMVVCTYTTILAGFVLLLYSAVKTRKIKD